MTRCRLPSLLSVLVVALCASPADAEEAAGSRPNIVFMLADDMGWAQPGFNGGTPELTPNIDRRILLLQKSANLARTLPRDVRGIPQRKP